MESSPLVCLRHKASLTANVVAEAAQTRIMYGTRTLSTKKLTVGKSLGEILSSRSLHVVHHIPGVFSQTS